MESDVSDPKQVQANDLAPGLHHVSWDVFQAAIDAPETFPIDVLAGEPGGRSAFSARPQPGITQGQDKGSVPPRPPERIRINSKGVIEILSIIHHVALSPRNKPLLMFRPYRALLGFEDEIHAWVCRLEKKLRQQGPALHDGQDCHCADSDAPDYDDVYTPGTLRDMRFLLLFLNNHIKPRLEYVRSPDCQSVTFSDLWLLFSPGGLVVGRDGRQVYRVIATSTIKTKKGGARRKGWRRFTAKPSPVALEDSAIVIKCVYIDCDGEQFGPVCQTFSIAKFDGEIEIALLDVFPFRLLPSERVESLVNRGRRVLEVSKIKHMYHDGSTLDSGEHVTGCVVIDPKLALAMGESGFERPKLDHFQSCSSGAIQGIEFDDDSTDNSDTEASILAETSYEDQRMESRRGDMFVHRQLWNKAGRCRSLSLAMSSQPIQAVEDVREEDFLLLHYRVYGYLLEAKEWAPLDAANLRHPETDVYSTEFERLVLPSGYKASMVSLLQHSILTRKGLFFLLHGPPGLGKFTTAKCLAGIYKKPLLRLPPWHVVDDVSEVEQQLEDHLRRSTRWDCLVLVDEADMLIRRYGGDYNDKVASLFFHFLDRYRGVMIFLTSQVDSIHYRLKPRLHLSLKYPPLNREGILRVFRLNIQRLKDHHDIDFEEDALLNFASAQFEIQGRSVWNCKEVENHFDSALALARDEHEYQRRDLTAAANSQEKRRLVLSVSHLERVASTLLDFTNFTSGGKTLGAIIPRGMLGPQNSEEQRRPKHTNLPPVWGGPMPGSVPQDTLNADLSAKSRSGSQTRAAAAPERRMWLTNTQTVSSIPDSNFIGWDEFVVGRGRSNTEGFAIDVLVGSPVVSLGDEAGKSLWWSSWPANTGNACKNSADKPNQSQGSAVPTVPERIRIRSKQIIKFLVGIFGKRVSQYDEAVVMTRPYRALSYYDSHIRRGFEQEVERALNPAGGDGSYSPKSNESSHVEPADSEPDNLSVAESDDSEREVSDESDVEVEATSEKQIEHIRCLINFLNSTIKVRQAYLDSDECELIAFADLWYIFKPGDEVFSPRSKQVSRIFSVNSSRHRFLPPWSSWDPKDDPRSREAQGTAPSVVIRLVDVDFNGTMLGPTLWQEEINQFDGEIAVRALPFFPLRLVSCEELGSTGNSMPSNTSAREALIARGRQFVDVIRIRPRHYNGPTIDTGEEVDSQVIIDFEQADAEDSGRRASNLPPIESMFGEDVNVRRKVFQCTYECCSGDFVYDDSRIDGMRNEAYVASCIPAPEGPEPTGKGFSLGIYPRALRHIDPSKISDEDLVIMSARVYGFILRSRKWAKLYVGRLSLIGDGDGRDQPHGPWEAKGQDHGATSGDLGQKGHAEAMGSIPSVIQPQRPTAFDKLVLPKGHKEIVMSLIGQHFQDKARKNQEIEETDIVRGKGKGLIILLHGAPGVGKTTTAEGVAEVFNKPLFQITCGDLGTTAVDVEEALERHFKLASRWGCVLLLDEADVFMAERSPQDFKRNSFVTVFLRVLEYYTGILFLTTNRIGDFDEAFSSRIHVSLYYPPLQLQPTLQIFQLNLGLIHDRITERARRTEEQKGPIEIDEDQILKFAEKYWKRNKKMRWNGRQIRNACQTALALAEYEAQRGVGGSGTSGGGSNPTAVKEGPPGSSPPPTEAAAAAAGSSGRVVVDAKAEAQRSVDSSARVRLTARHLETVSEAYLGFMQYLRDVHGRDAERRAKALGIRARELAHDASEIRKGLERMDGDDDGDDAGDRREFAQGQAPAQPVGVAVGGATAGAATPSAALSSPFSAAANSGSASLGVLSPTQGSHQLYQQQQHQMQQGSLQVPGTQQPVSFSGQPLTQNQLGLAMAMMQGGGGGGFGQGGPMMYQHGPFVPQGNVVQNLGAFTANMGQLQPQQPLTAEQQQQQQFQQQQQQFQQQQQQQFQQYQ
ncbi:hypothetical protein RB595_007278 [Gaeumannomyces hyphopodioides]